VCGIVTSSADKPVPGPSSVLPTVPELPYVTADRCILCEVDTGKHLQQLTARGIPKFIDHCHLTKKDTLADYVLLVHTSCRDDLKY